MRKILILLKVVISLVLIIYIISKIGISNIVNGITTINYWYLPAVFLVYLFSIYVGAYKVKIFLDRSYKIRFSGFFKSFITSNSVGMFLPGKLGDFSLLYLIKKENQVKAVDTFSILLIDKIITLLVVLLISLIGFLLLFMDLFYSYLFFGIIVLSGLLILTGFFVFGKKIIKLILGKYYGHFDEINNYILDVLKNHKYLVLGNIVLTIFKIIVVVAAYYLSFLALGENINIFWIFLIVTIAAFFTFFPISISGLGIREGIAVFLFGKLNVPNTLTFNAFMVLILLAYVLALVVLIMYKPFHRNNDQSNERPSPVVNIA